MRIRKTALKNTWMLLLSGGLLLSAFAVAWEPLKPSMTETNAPIELSTELTPEMDRSEPQFFKPLVNHNDPMNPSRPPLQGRAEKNGEVPVNNAPQKTLVLTGKVQTLQEAITSESETVNWYAWYLSAREYLGLTGGLRCSLGTPIKFHKSGKIEAITFDTACIGSVIGRRFPLPANTKLDAVILPVRSGSGPPASEAEIYTRIRPKAQ